MGETITQISAMAQALAGGSSVGRSGESYKQNLLVLNAKVEAARAGEMG
jgi:hypothetical protein